MKLINTAIICHELHFYRNYIRYQPVPGKQRARILVKKTTLSQCRRELTRFPLLLISHGIWMLESHISEADEAYFRLFTIKVNKWAGLLFRIRQFPGANLDPETGLSWLKFFFHDCPQSLKANSETAPEITSRPLPSSTFDIHYSPCH